MKKRLLIICMVLFVVMIISCKQKNPNAPLKPSGHGSSWSQVSTLSTFDARAFHSSVVFADDTESKMWVIGGYSNNDVYSSIDGGTWVQVTSSAAFGYRYGHTSVVYNDGSGDKMWVIGGWGSGGVINDVWKSGNGASWVCVTNTAGFCPRYTHTSIVYNNKIWVIGGYYFDNATHFTTALNDVWNSSDGVTWTCVKQAAAFSARGGHTSVVFDGKMWIIGGCGGNGLNDNNEVWNSNDGVTWNEVSSNAGFTARVYHTSVVYAGRIFVMGGAINNNGSFSGINDVWSSSDGVKWLCETSSAGFGYKCHHSSLVFNDKIWVIAGFSFVGTSDGNDVWYSQ